MCVFHISHDLTLHVALRLEAGFLTQRKTNYQLWHVIFYLPFSRFLGKILTGSVYQFLGLSCRLLVDLAASKRKKSGVVPCLELPLHHLGHAHTCQPSRFSREYTGISASLQPYFLDSRLFSVILLVIS